MTVSLEREQVIDAACWAGPCLLFQAGIWQAVQMLPLPSVDVNTLVLQTCTGFPAVTKSVRGWLWYPTSLWLGIAFEMISLLPVEIRAWFLLVLKLEGAGLAFIPSCAPAQLEVIQRGSKRNLFFVKNFTLVPEEGFLVEQA